MGHSRYISIFERSANELKIQARFENMVSRMLAEVEFCSDDKYPYVLRLQSGTPCVVTFNLISSNNIYCVSFPQRVLYSTTETFVGNFVTELERRMEPWHRQGQYKWSKTNIFFLYQDWLDNHLTRQSFADYYEITLAEAETIIARGKIIAVNMAHCLASDDVIELNLQRLEGGNHADN